MPALKLFGRKWLVASDDFVFPGLFEIVFRLIWLILIGVVVVRYYTLTWTCQLGGELVRAYTCGTATLLTLIILVLVVLVNRSAQGSITDTYARRHVPAVLLVKICLIIPEIVWNCLGTIWAFSNLVQCTDEHFTTTVVKVMVLFNWVLLALTLFGLAFVFDPLGSVVYNESQPEVEALRHRKVTRLWIRRLQWFFCWICRDQHSHEAFQLIACLASDMFRSTDLVPTDFMAGCVLLRVRQKMRTRELRRLQLIEEYQPPKYSIDPKEVFVNSPHWMTVDRAHHFIKMAISSYGWPFVLYQYPVSGLCKLIPKMFCCSCFRSKEIVIQEDNCCMCNFAGVKYLSQLPPEDILFASFHNNIFELPFLVIADHKTKSIVIACRGSMSLRDVFTDLAAAPDNFEADELPPDTKAHRGMIVCAQFMLKTLEEASIIEKAFAIYPRYKLVITGHSLGAGVAVLLGFKLRPQYPDLLVYAAAAPAGTLSREAARIAEEFVFTVGVGDDMVMRMGVQSVEDLRNNVVQVLQVSRLPKYRIMLNGFGYAMFGVPSRDLESTWKSDQFATLSPLSGAHEQPLLFESPTTLNITDISLLAKNVWTRRFCSIRLYVPGKILHITRRKKTKAERKSGIGGPDYAFRWASAEEFNELRVMPRMFLDHLPENVYDVVGKVVEEMKANTITEI